MFIYTIYISSPTLLPIYLYGEEGGGFILHISVCGHQCTQAMSIPLHIIYRTIAGRGVKKLPPAHMVENLKIVWKTWNFIT